MQQHADYKKLAAYAKSNKLTREQLEKLSLSEVSTIANKQGLSDNFLRNMVGTLIEEKLHEEKQAEGRQLKASMPDRAWEKLRIHYTADEDAAAALAALTTGTTPSRGGGHG